MTRKMGIYNYQAKRKAEQQLINEGYSEIRAKEIVKKADEEATKDLNNRIKLLGEKFEKELSLR